MSIKNFKDFTDSLNESEWHYYRGKTPFSRWLRSMDDRFKPMWQTRSKDDKGPDAWSRAIPILGSLISSGGAAIADFFSKGRDREKFSTKSYKQLKSDRSDFLDDWENEHFKDKKVSERDAEDFYKSGVLKGKKYFGKDYDPKKPRNEGEREYTEYLTSAMKKYYEKLK